jgi:type IV pilus assembly protein PilW
MTPRHRHEQRARQAGLSLVELLVALTIGLFLMAGAISVFGKTRDLYRTNEATARLQDSARYAMSTLEGDLRMASHWGPSNRADFITNAAAPGQTLDAALAPYEAVIDACGDNWAVNAATYVEGSNNGYGLGCAAFGTASTDADVLTIRRASFDVIPDASLAATDGQLKLRASRTQSALFGDDTLPAGLTGAGSETRALVVHGYYVDDDSDERPGTPSLRRKRLWFDAAATAPVIEDQQVISGIEDLQVEAGVDTNGDQGAEYFTTFDDVAAGDAVVALRVWVLARAEQADATYTDDRTYEYADRAAFTPGDNFRRMLVSKTIQLRNSRQ